MIRFLMPGHFDFYAARLLRNGAHGPRGGENPTRAHTTFASKTVP
jgi:hypothetical protein